MKSAEGMGAGAPRVLALVSRLKRSHIDYLLAIAAEVDLRVLWVNEANEGAGALAIREGLRAAPIGPIDDGGESSPLAHARRKGFRALFAARIGPHRIKWQLGSLVSHWRPSVIHVLYYYHNRLTVLVRRLVDRSIPVIYECRDPLTTLWRTSPGEGAWNLEADALRASDRQIFVSRALRTYFERAHGVDLETTSIVVPHAFARRSAAPASEKLSAADGRVHIALVGSADCAPDHGRWSGDIIRRLVSAGLVVHSHFFEIPERPLDAYRALSAELADYRFHPTVSYRKGTELSELTSRYDLMGVFHELEAAHHNEAATLAVCMPTKAVSAWIHGAIPVVTFRHYRGLVEVIEELGTGWVIDRWDDLRAIIADRDAIERATAKCVVHRDRFSHEHQAKRVAAFYRSCGPALP